MLLNTPNPDEKRRMTCGRNHTMGGPPFLGDRRLLCLSPGIRGSAPKALLPVSTEWL